jgi:hypothetical protein
VSDPDPNTPPADPPADPAPDDGEVFDLAAEVGAIVDEKLKGVQQPAPNVKPPADPTPQAPAPRTTDAGVVEDTVRRLLDQKEHDAEHERLSAMGDQQPRQSRRGIARVLFGE